MPTRITLGLFALMLIVGASSSFAADAPASGDAKPATADSSPLKPLTTDEGFVDLYNGKDFTGWEIDGTKENKNAAGELVPIWNITDGIIHCRGTGFGFLRSEKQYTDFALAVEYRMLPGCNSGIGIRHKKFKEGKDRPSYSGYEVQILDDAGKEPRVKSTASLYRYVAPTSLPVKKAGEWNVMIIQCVGTKIKITLNDIVVMDIDQTDYPEIKDKPLKGHVSLQNHGQAIEFRRVQLKDLAATAK
ncbi:MAG: DUF1080 domain-containing protein [Planctomycetota bacterium]|nr:DUF1080 domain-containing protein [Planctomycetota bacterium]